MSKVLALVVLIFGYLGVGFLHHAIILGSTLSASSAATWGVLIAWPAIWIIGGVALMLSFAFAATFFVSVSEFVSVFVSGFKKGYNKPRR
jgi:hypothetical protein